MVNDYINNNENVPKIKDILNAFDSSETEFVGCRVHIPENPLLKEYICAQN